MKSARSLDKFGRLVTSSLYDEPLEQLEGLLKKKWKAPALKQLQARLSSLDEDDQRMVRQAVRDCLECAIHSFLFALVEAHDFESGIEVLVDGENVVDLSDGLQGEPPGKNGWIARFSKHTRPS